MIISKRFSRERQMQRQNGYERSDRDCYLFANFLWYFNLLSICLIVHNCIKMHTCILIALLGWCLTLYTQYSNRSALSAGCDGYTCICNDFFQMLHLILCFAVDSLTLVHNLTFLISIEIKGT